MIQDKFLTVHQVAELLQISWRAVLREINKGNLRAVKIGRSYRIASTALDKYIKENSTGGNKK